MSTSRQCPGWSRGPAEGLVLACPGAAADLGHGRHLLGPYAQRCRHGLQQRRIGNIPGLDGKPLLGTHAGQESDYLKGNAAVLPGLPHKDAEQLAPDLALWLMCRNGRKCLLLLRQQIILPTTSGLVAATYTCLHINFMRKIGGTGDFPTMHRHLALVIGLFRGQNTP